MIVKIRMLVPDSFIEIEIDEYRNGRFKKYTAKEANRLLTRANSVEEPENRPTGSYLDLPNTIGIFAPGPSIKFEYQGVQKSFTGEIPYEEILDNRIDPIILRDVFLKRIKAVRSWTDQQIEVKCERVDPGKLGIFSEESRRLFSEEKGKLHVLVQYLMTGGPNPMPNIEIFINGRLCENRRNRPPKDLRESTEYIVAKGANGEVIHPHDHLSIFTPRGPTYHYGTWKSHIIVMGGEIDYGGNQRDIERALSERIAYFRKNVTDLIRVDMSFARR